MDRFDILKYTILLEEYFKKKIIEKVLFNSKEKSFISSEAFDGWKEAVRNKLKKFSKKNKRLKDSIYHCTAWELVELFQLLTHEIRTEIFRETFLKNIIDNLSKIKTILTGNKLIRDTLAHPTLHLEKVINSMTTFTFLDGNFKNNYERVQKFYVIVKNNI